MTNEKRFEITDIRLRGIPLAPMVLDTHPGVLKLAWRKCYPEESEGWGR